MKEYVLVPQEDLDKLEAVRKELTKYLSYVAKYSDNITDRFCNPLYKFTHTKYRKAVDLQEVG